ncbi:MAG: rhomboid family intramembrane serine protease [Pseudomonadota bacterium]
MIPYKDENPTHVLPVVTYAILGLNIFAWLLLQGMGSEPALTQSICRYGAIPGAMLSNAALSSAEDLVCPVVQQGWLQALTSMFMHGGWMHLIGNMWFLWIFADNIEDSIGHVRFIIFYLIGGLAAIAAQMAADPGSMIPMVGASGAIGGVMGAYARLFPKVRVHMAIILGFFIMRQTLPAWVMLGLWLGFQVISGVLSLSNSAEGGVAFWAHIGGFLAGFILIPLFFSGHKTSRQI